MKNLFGLALLLFLLAVLNFLMQEPLFAYLQFFLTAVLLVLMAYKIEKLEDKG